MVIFFTATLAISVVGLLALISLKRFEMNTGRVVLGRARPMVGEFMHRLVFFVERVLPALIVRLLLRAAAALRRGVHAAVAWGIIVLERLLESTLRGIRRTTSMPEGKRAVRSDFLREVAEHKKKLQELGDRAIYEE